MNRVVLHTVAHVLRDGMWVHSRGPRAVVLIAVWRCGDCPSGSAPGTFATALS